MLTGCEITVIGAGIGGLAAALALAQRGARVRVLEQADAIREVGAGLQISPNGVAVLDALGVGQAARDAGMRSTAVELRDYAQGRKVVRLELGSLASERPYLLLHRADLISLLAQAAQAAGVTVQLNSRVSDVSLNDLGATLTFADDSCETVDLVIGADGLHSRLRGALNGDAAPFFTGQVAWRALVPGTGASRRDVHVYMGPGRHLVSYPLRGGSLTNIVAVEERSEWASEGWNHQGDPADLRRAFAGFCPDEQALLAQVDEVYLWGLFRHNVARKWFSRGCALLGDAAHPTLPFMAQGANMALEDAWVLADCLDSLETDLALTAYQTRRCNRACRVIEAANANAHNYHLRPGVTRLAAHGALRLAGALAPGTLLQRFDWIYKYDVTRTQSAASPK